MQHNKTPKIPHTALEWNVSVFNDSNSLLDQKKSPVCVLSPSEQFVYVLAEDAILSFDILLKKWEVALPNIERRSCYYFACACLSPTLLFYYNHAENLLYFFDLQAKSHSSVPCTGSNDDCMLNTCETAYTLRFDASSQKQFLYTFGGAATSDNYFYNDICVLDIEKAQWSKLATSVKPPKRSACASAYDKRTDMWFIYGGFESARMMDMYAFSFQTKIWKKIMLQEGIPGLSDLGAAMVDSTFYMYGGYTRNKYKLFAINMETSEWNPISIKDSATGNEVTSGRNLHQMFYLKTTNELLVIGGKQDSGEPTILFIPLPGRPSMNMARVRSKLCDVVLVLQ